MRISKEETAVLKQFVEKYGITEKESKILKELVFTEDTIQDIAKGQYLSRTALYRYMEHLFDKAGVRSRIGLIRKFYLLGLK